MGRVVFRLGLSATAAVAVTVMASTALFVTTWPKWLSLGLEPLSLLLTPGVIASMLFTGKHDYQADPSLGGSCVFYFLVFFLLLMGRDWLGLRRR